MGIVFMELIVVIMLIVQGIVNVLMGNVWLLVNVKEVVNTIKNVSMDDALTTITIKITITITKIITITIIIIMTITIIIMTTIITTIMIIIIIIVANLTNNVKKKNNARMDIVLESIDLNKSFNHLIINYKIFTKINISFII
jgi:hypothetical protein